VSIIPLCGDQGAGIGAYNINKGDLIWPNHLFWGIRDLESIENEDRLIIVNNIEEGLDLLGNYLEYDYIVNFVYGNMEFGARALGQTTTFALPYVDNVEYINHLNNRSTIMPMAGIINSKRINLYKDVDKVFKSLEYMIITRTHIHLQPHADIMGCHHKHPLRTEYTNRMQLLSRYNLLSNILNKHGMLINTSFNRHGVPIVFTPKQILETHRYQVERDHDNRVRTIIVRYKNV